MADDLIQTGRTSLARSGSSLPPVLYDPQGKQIRMDLQQEIYQGRTPDPGIPLVPAEPRGEEPRTFIPTVGQNLNYMPRTEYPWLTPFDQLRNLASASWIVACAINDVKEQMVGMPWDVHSIEKKNAGRLKDNIARVKNFLRRPDRIHDFRGWMMQLCDDALVLDALTLYRQRTVSGEPYALRPINGATIKPIVDAFGTPPPAPATAYQQIAYGRVETEYHRPYENQQELELALRLSRSSPEARPVEMVYAPRCCRTFTPYGQSPTERVIIILNIALRRDIYYLNYYTEGNIPEAFWKCPPEWTPSQILDMQDKFERLLAGEVGARRKLRFMAGGEGCGLENPRGQDQWQKDFDEYLARAVCFAFSTSPLPLVQLMNRATGQMADAEETHSGFNPLRGYFAELITREIHEFLGEPEVEFIWTEGKEANEQLEYERNVAYVDRGILSADEVRGEKGLEPIGLAHYISTASGPLFVSDLLAEHQLHDTTGVRPGAGGNPLDVPLPPAAGGGSAMRNGGGGGPAGGAGGDGNGRGSEAARALDVPLPPASAGKVRLPDHGRLTRVAVTLGAPVKKDDGFRIRWDDGGAADLRRWRKVALKAVAGGSRVKAFRSSSIAPELHKALQEWLETILCAEEVDWAFRSLVKARRPLISVRRRLRLERALRTAAKDHFLSQADDVAKVVAGFYASAHPGAAAEKVRKQDGPTDDDLDRALNWDVFMEEVKGPIEQAFLEGETIAGDTHGISVEFGITDEQAAEYAEERAAELIGKRVLEDGTIIDSPTQFAVSQTVRDDLRQTIATALKEGWTERELQESIEASTFWTWRADRIARTEVAVALNKGTAITYRSAGVETVTLIDGHGCLMDGHDDSVPGVNGQVVTIDEYEENPVGHPNCIRDAVPNLPQ